MINFLRITLLLISTGLLLGCSQVLETIDLNLNEKDEVDQEKFNVIEKTLSVAEARKQNQSEYSRQIMQSGRGNEAKTVAENIAAKSNFPSNTTSFSYRLGIGDVISFSRLIDNSIVETETNISWPPTLEDTDYRLGVGDELTILQMVETKTQTTIAAPNSENETAQTIKPSETLQKIIEAKGRIGSDGSILLLEVGRLDALGKTLNELRSEVRNILIRNGSSPRFQLEISKFSSQRAYLTMNAESTIISLNDQKTNLRDVLSSAGKGITPGVVTRVRLQRNKKTFNMKLRDIFHFSAPKVMVQDRDHIFVEDSASETVVNKSTVGQDGNIVLEGVGNLMALGKTLTELKKEISFLLEKLPNSENAFQLEISEFASKSAILSISGKSGRVIQITNRDNALSKVLTEIGISVDSNVITRIKLKRGGVDYIFTLKDLLDLPSDKVLLQPNDRIFIEILPYKENKVFVIGGIEPQIVNIKPDQRQTLADILFTPGGVLSSPSAKRSEVYLLRGSDPVVAYHLDAQNPTRLIVADAMELRPNDILFVAEQPIISFNRALATIVPLRILLRDIQDENIP